MRKPIGITLLFFSMLFLSSCGDLTQEKIAVVSLDKVISHHELYSAWERASQNELDAQNMKEKYMTMLEEQVAILKKIEELGNESQVSFLEADYVVKMSDASLLERERLNQIRKEQKLLIDKEINEKIKLIEEEYKIPLFNLRSNLEMVKPLVRSKEEAEEEKERLLMEFKALKEEKNNKIRLLQEEGGKKLAIVMEKYEEESLNRLKDLSITFSKEAVDKVVDKAGVSEERLGKIEPAFEKTLLSFEKQIKEHKMLKEKIYTRMLDDIRSKTMKIALEKKYTTVLHSVTINLHADDITDLLIKEIKSSQQKKEVQ